MVQLWVNLPKAYKMSPPRYQSLGKQQIPAVKLDGGELRVIAGEYGGPGARRAHSPRSTSSICGCRRVAAQSWNCRKRSAQPWFC